MTAMLFVSPMFFLELHPHCISIWPNTSIINPSTLRVAASIISANWTATRHLLMSPGTYFPHWVQQTCKQKPVMLNLNYKPKFQTWEKNDTEQSKENRLKYLLLTNNSINIHHFWMKTARATERAKTSFNAKHIQPWFQESTTLATNWYGFSMRMSVIRSFGKSLK